MELTEKNIKAIRNEKRAGYIFAAMLISFAALGNFGYFLSSAQIPIALIVGVDCGIVFTALLISHSLNKEYNMDLKDGSKIVTLEKIEKKETVVDYEAGSGTLHIPVLGDIFPKLWGQKMREIRKSSLVIKGKKHWVEKQLFDSVSEGDEVEMHYAGCSGTLLEIQCPQKL